MAENCPFCNRHGRADNITRHIATHKKDIHTIMHPDAVKICLENKFPILYKRNVCVYCLICHKNAREPSSIIDFNDKYSKLHKNCIQQFETVKKYYRSEADCVEPIFKNTIIDEPTNDKLYEMQKKYQKIDDTCNQYQKELENMEDKYRNAISCISEILYKINIHVHPDIIVHMKESIEKCNKIIENYDEDTE